MEPPRAASADRCAEHSATVKATGTPSAGEGVTTKQPGERRVAGRAARGAVAPLTQIAPARPLMPRGIGVG